MLLPLLNALTSARHLGVSVPQGDWVLAGFDLTMLMLGAAFAWAAVHVRRRAAQPAARTRRQGVDEAAETGEPA